MRHSTIRRFPSPLRYPGGKGKIANYMKLLFIRNGFDGYEYVEPYAGGSSVALSLLYEGYASHIHINDLNRGVYAFWYAVLHDTDWLCKRIRDTKVTMTQWQRQRKVQLSESPDQRDLAFSTFFLNRTNRSGIISGGVIGGKGQDGDWSLDARYNAPALIQRIAKVERHSPRITLTGKDAAIYLSTVLPKLPDRTFVYLDPPYFEKGKKLYENSYEPGDHAKIAKLARGIRQRWIVSYDSQPHITALYRTQRSIGYDLSYSAADKYEGAEVMYFGPRVICPEVDSPARISQKVVDHNLRSRANR